MLLATTCLAGVTPVATAHAQSQSTDDGATQLRLAQANEAAEARSFAIPGGPLAGGLTAFGRQSGLQIAAETSLLEGRRTLGVSGELTPEEALRQLLSGTGLTSRFADANTVMLVQVHEGGPVRLGPITVTGERVERSIRETASAVSVTTAADIEADPSLRDVEDVFQTLTNVTESGTDGNGPTVRGIDTTGPLIGANAFLGGSRPRATITVDGRPMSFFEYTQGSAAIFDVERVEVFKGPQTTSQGSNSIAGATHVVTADPTFTPEGKAQGEFGNFENRRVSLAVSGPVVEDEVAVRIAGDYQSRKSFAKGIPPIQGFDEDEFEYLTLRSKVLWEPAANDALSTKLTVTFSKVSEPQVEFIAPPFDPLVFGPATSSGFTSEVISATNDVSYDISDNLTVSNRFTYANSKIDRFADNPAAGRAVIKQNDFVEEVTLNMSGLDGRLSGLVGGSLYLSDVADSIDLTAFLGLSEFDDLHASTGVFGEATYALTERLDVTAGLRYQYDYQHREGFLGPFTLDFHGAFDAFLPKFGVGYDVSDNLRVGAQVSRGFNPGGVTISFVTGAADFFDEETVWNYEIFARSSFLDNRLHLNANVFYSDFYDFQQSEVVLVGGAAVLEITNADRARSYGLEVSADYQHNDRLKLFGSIGLLNTEITEFDVAVDPNAVGRQFPRSPNFTMTLGADYEAIDDLTLGGRARFSGGYFSDFNNTAAFRVNSYAIFDFKARYSIGSAELYAYLDNAFNAVGPASKLNIGGGLFGTVITPREFGAGLRYKF